MEQITIETADTPTMDTVIAKQKQSSTTALRVVGVMLILIASGIYLFQGADALNPYARHFIFLGITALFGAMTWITGGVLKEMKGARTFIALAVTTVPVLFTQMGAMIHAIVVNNSDVVKALYFAPLKVSTVALIIAGTSAVTLPVIFLGNRILARTQMKPLTIFMVVLNVVLLFPVRNILFVSPILIGSVAAILVYLMKSFKRDASVQNREGTIAASMLFIPSLIMASRTALLYNQSSFFPGLIMILAGAASVVLPFNRKTVAASLLKMAGVISIVTGWCIALSGVLPGANVVRYYLATVPALAILVALSFIFNGKTGRSVRTFALFAVMAIVGMGQVLFSGAYPSLISIIAGIALIVGATKMKEKSALIYGGLTLVAGVVGMVYLAMTALTTSSWIILMIGGVIIIAGGSLTELFNNQWKGHVNSFRSEIAAWK